MKTVEHVNPDGNKVRVKLGDGVTLGDRVKLGDGVKLGDRVKLGDGVTLGDWVTLGDGVTSEQLNEIFRALYAYLPEHVFDKWVTPGRRSPNFDGGTPLLYGVGAILEEKEAQVSDQQCAVGLHVLRHGYRPEWLGLCEANHDLICIHVKVRAEDICFAGLPTNDAKIRVRRLEVLD